MVLWPLGLRLKSFQRLAVAYPLLPYQTVIDPLSHARITRGQPTSILNNIFGQYSILTLPECLISHLSPPLFGLPEQSAKVQ